MDIDIRMSRAVFCLSFIGLVSFVSVHAAGIQRVNLDGSGLTTLIKGTKEGGYSYGIALDIEGGYVYWTESSPSPDRIMRAKLDGSEVTELAKRKQLPLGMALDLNGGHLYWAERRNASIWRANLDGSGITPIVTRQHGVIDVALDIDSRNIYWTGVRNTVRRMLLGDSAVIDVIEHSVNPRGIALDTEGGKMYFLNFRGVHRANLDGSDVIELVKGQKNPVGIALDAEGGKIYWTEHTHATDKVMRANFDGSDVTDLVTGLERPGQLALDLQAGHIYLTSGVSPR